MPRFFLSASACALPPSEDMPQGGFHIGGGDAHHIAYSLRMRVGEELTVCDMQKQVYRCEIVSFARAEGRERDRQITVIVRVLESHPSDTEPTYRAVLFQAMPKAGKLDVIIQKAVETGVSRIVPFLSERCVVRPDADGARKKCERWQKIAKEAAMQCGRAVVPEVALPVSFAEAVREAASCGLSLFCYEGDGTVPLGRVLASSDDSVESVGFVVGAEGGFSLEEAQAAREAGLVPTGLGKRILRCETASGFVLSCLTCHFDLQ